MGAIMQSIWINYSLRVYEPEFWSEENIKKANEFRLGLPEADSLPPVRGLEVLDEYEKLGGEDASFREHVHKHITKWNALGDDPYWNFDERIHKWINKVFDHKIELGRKWLEQNDTTRANPDSSLH